MAKKKKLKNKLKSMKRDDVIRYGKKLLEPYKSLSTHYEKMMFYRIASEVVAELLDREWNINRRI